MRTVNDEALEEEEELEVSVAESRRLCARTLFVMAMRSDIMKKT